MGLNRLIAKRADLLRFNKPDKIVKRRKEPHNFILDYILFIGIFLGAILLFLFLIIGVFFS